jgi:hypothetical protein
MYRRASRAQFVLRPPGIAQRELVVERGAQRAAARERHQHGFYAPIKIARAHVKHAHEVVSAHSTRPMGIALL